MDTPYPNILILHSLIRWIISILFIVSIVRLYLKRNQTGKIELWDKRLINENFDFSEYNTAAGYYWNNISLSWNSQNKKIRFIFIYVFAFLVIFFSIPWEFSPLTSQPLWRWF